MGGASRYQSKEKRYQNQKLKVRAAGNYAEMSAVWEL